MLSFVYGYYGIMTKGHLLTKKNYLEVGYDHSIMLRVVRWNLKTFGIGLGLEESPIYTAATIIIASYHISWPLENPLYE